MFIRNIIILLWFISLFLCNNQTQARPSSEEFPKEDKDTIKNPSQEEEKKMQEIYSLMHDFNRVWETKLENYNSDYDYSIPLKPRMQELYFENVTTVPATFVGAFIISDETTDKIEFMVRDPNGKIIYQVTKHHDVFEIPVKIIGKYAISFNNRISKSDLMVTFTMNSGQNNLLNAQDLTKTEQKLEALNAVIKKFNLEFKFGHDIHTKRYQSKFTII